MNYEELQWSWPTNDTPELLIRIWQLPISICISPLPWKPNMELWIICSERLLPFRLVLCISVAGIKLVNENGEVYYCFEMELPNSLFVILHPSFVLKLLKHIGILYVENRTKRENIWRTLKELGVRMWTWFVWQERRRWLGLVNSIMTLRVLYKTRNSLIMNALLASKKNSPLWGSLLDTASLPSVAVCKFLLAILWNSSLCRYNGRKTKRSPYKVSCASKPLIKHSQASGVSVRWSIKAHFTCAPNYPQRSWF